METEDEFLDSFSGRYRNCDFLYPRNDQYKVVELELERSNPSEHPLPVVDIFTVLS